MKKMKFKIAGSFVAVGLLVLAGCSPDNNNEEVMQEEEEVEVEVEVEVEEENSEEENAEEVVEEEVVEEAGDFDVNYSFQPGGNMGMPAASDLQMRLDFSTVNPDNDLVTHVNYNILVENDLGDVVYGVNGAHEHEGYHEVLLGPLPEGEYTVGVTVTPTPDTPEDDQFEEISREFEFATMPIEAVHDANLSVEVPELPNAGEATKFGFTIEDEDGNNIPHTDNLLRIAKDGVIFYQATNLHTHTGEMEISYTFPEPGTYDVTLSSSPTPMRASVNFAPIGESFTVEVQ